MSDYIAVCGECQHLKPSLFCPVQGHVRKYDRIICEHFKAKEVKTNASSRMVPAS